VKVHHLCNLVHGVDHLVGQRATRSEPLIWPPMTAYHALIDCTRYANSATSLVHLLGSYNDDDARLIFKKSCYGLTGYAHHYCKFNHVVRLFERDRWRGDRLASLVADLL
jgi:hypothetical protein